MPNYVIARKSRLMSNEHEMHTTVCHIVDNPKTYASVGVYNTSLDALDAAQKLWPPIQIKKCGKCC